MSNKEHTYGSATQSALHLLKQWKVFMDGIDRIYAFWGTPSNPQSIQGIDWQKNRYKEEELLSIDNGLINNLQRSTAKTKTAQWLQPSSLPFATEDEKVIGQLDLFSESNYLVLHIQTPLDETGNLAWYYLFFRDDKSNFGIMGYHEVLSTSEKAIIGRLANNYANASLNSYNEMKLANGRLKENTQKLLITKHKEVECLNADLKNWKNLWLDRYLVQISQRDGLHYVISEKSKEILFSNCHNLEQLEKSIIKSFVYICELYEFEQGDDVELNPAYVQIEAIVEIKQDEILNPVITRISKTMLLLDRLEAAAEKVLEEGIKLTSAEVGKNMDKAITAPAISDALKKNKVRILQLFAEHPANWPTIRRQFKPVVNLNEKNKHEVNSTS